MSIWTLKTRACSLLYFLNISRSVFVACCCCWCSFVRSQQNLTPIFPALLWSALGLLRFNKVALAIAMCYGHRFCNIGKQQLQAVVLGVWFQRRGQASKVTAALWSCLCKEASTKLLQVSVLTIGRCIHHKFTLSSSRHFTLPANNVHDKVLCSYSLFRPSIRW